MNSRQIELIDGPMAGIVHEMYDGLPVPEAIGFPSAAEDVDSPKHWYGIVGNRGYYVDTVEGVIDGES